MQLNHTHDPATRSWLPSATDTDFPIQNLPLAVFRRSGSDESFRGGVAIGDQVLDLAALSGTACLQGLAAQAAGACAQAVLNGFLALGPAAWQALRHALFGLLQSSAPGTSVAAVRACLLPQDAVEYAVPMAIGDYTDFYTSIHHARNVGRIARPDAPPLTPNFQWLPIAYHGRASSIVVSGQRFRRPMGQFMPAGASTPVYGPCARLDYELELGICIGQGNALGEPIALAQAESHIFGLCLLNDWSARDIQFWEMAPLGPFLGKNFATSVSPWLVSLEALAPFRLPFERPADEPQPLAYLESAGNRAQGVLDVRLEVLLQTARQRSKGQPGTRVSHTSFRHQYWTLAQMVTQHTVGGCNLQPGDLLGTGTISGPQPQEAGAMVELTKGGREPLTLTHADGVTEQRAFLQDGDAVILRGWCEAPGRVRIGFGECRGEVLPALGA
ncbi:MAG: fumarylacetoacetase [Rhodoferax sp.]|uniref:fumarylacetoacetase n=1 Tax=Rhodoferax sp. TaxID=50421 RepID=UPI002637FFB7|nr:fumarylacetoacetase [Rhodoferax sp.]MDD5335418.1 fumarylacetoacetase [Rhodoferax sp.]